jgi:hypothetical protein
VNLSHPILAALTTGVPESLVVSVLMVMLPLAMRVPAWEIPEKLNHDPNGQTFCLLAPSD